MGQSDPRLYCPGSRIVAGVRVRVVHERNGGSARNETRRAMPGDHVRRRVLLLVPMSQQSFLPMHGSLKNKVNKVLH